MGIFHQIKKQRDLCSRPLENELEITCSKNLIYARLPLPPNRIGSSAEHQTIIQRVRWSVRKLKKHINYYLVIFIFMIYKDIVNRFRKLLFAISKLFKRPKLLQLQKGI